MKLADLSNQELLTGIRDVIGQGRFLLARLLAYLGEIEERRLELESACSSLFDFCLRRLGMSEDEACRRVAASRLARRFPLALAMIERGEIHLTTLLLLREQLTAENHEELLRAVAGKTKGQVQEFLASRFPRPDAPSLIQELPTAPTPQPPTIPSPQPARSRVEALSPERYKVQFTATAELKSKIDQIADLMRHANPSGDLAVIMDRALDLLLVELEKRRLGRTKRTPPKRAAKNTRPGYVTRAVRREVFERDGARCTFVDETGRRCESCTFLELDHIDPRARGGPDSASNLRIRCAAHNSLAAEHHFGRHHVERKKSEKRAVLRESQPREIHPRQRVWKSDLALRALTIMGFKEPQARRALAIIDSRVANRSSSLETTLREAISILTP
ncbi:HNH endonuclease [Pendulispora rubella]|uniref:HNH endonuclease n=1 Tax=Pendulispora rubella TaxID=2741070 RepID=A0ABZ2L8M2_9BACT